jgi:hypothetical protein
MKVFQGDLLFYGLEKELAGYSKGDDSTNRQNQ